MTTRTEPRERGILFSDRLVRAILDGRKAQTRRIVKRVGNDNCLPLPGRMKTHVLDAPERGLCPYGVPGDRLYVREAWAGLQNGGNFDELTCSPSDMIPDFTEVRYRASETPAIAEADPDVRGYRWKPSIHMPKWASRIMLEITGVRVERVQEISDEDAQAEGAWSPLRYVGAHRDEFSRLWDQTNGHRDGCSWADNPWVWVIEFRRTEEER